jgi:hypothetical protein
VVEIRIKAQRLDIAIHEPGVTFQRKPFVFRSG